MITVAVVGLGTLGSRAIQMLSRLDIDVVGIDRDIVQQANLGNQPLYASEDLGQPKALVAARKVVMVPIADELNEDTLSYLNVDIIVDGLDNMPTRQLIAWYANKYSIPYVYGAAAGNQATVGVFSKNTGSFSSVFSSKAEGLTCSSEGISMDAADWVARKQYALVKDILAEKKVASELFYYTDGEEKILKLPESNTLVQKVPVKSKAIKLCGRDLFQVWIDDAVAHRKVKGSLFVKEDGMTIFSNGRVLIEAKTEKEALALLRF